MVATRIAIVTNVKGDIIDAERLDSRFSWSIEAISRTLRPGDSLEVLDRRLTEDDIAALEREEAERAKNQMIEDARQTLIANGYSIDKPDSTD